MFIKIKNRPVRVSLRFLYRPFLNLFSLILNKEPFAFPSSLQLEPSNICNLKCNMCALNYMKRKRGTMEFSLFKKVIDEIKPSYLCLTGYTDAFMNKDIFKMISYAEKFSTVKIDTNATLLNEETIQGILTSKLDILSISLDSTNKKNFESIRKGANLDNVMKGIEILSDYRRKMKSNLQIHFAITIQKKNMGDLLEVLKFAKKIGADYTGVTFMTNYGVNEKKFKDLQISKQDIPRLKIIINEAKSFVKKSNLNASFASIELFFKHDADYEKLAMLTPCYYSWYSAYISYEGDVFSCGCAYDGQIKFGNLKGKTFREIWHSKEYQGFRRKMRKGKFGFCSKCVFSDMDIYRKIKKIPFINLQRI